jgi:hypothetical protein
MLLVRFFSSGRNVAYVTAVSADKYPSLLTKKMYIMTQKQVCNRWIDCTVLRTQELWGGDKLQLSTRFALSARYKPVISGFEGGTSGVAVILVVKR